MTVIRLPIVCLTGVDTTFEDGKLRVIAAVTSNGEYPVELSLRNTTPDGRTRFAAITKTVVGVDTVAIEVPLAEAGQHEISAVLNARFSQDGNMTKIFEMPATSIDVPFTFEGLVVDSATIQQEDASILVHAAVTRTSVFAPRRAALIVRDTALGLATIVYKDLEDETTVIGLKAEIEAGVHHLVCSIATDVEGELTEVLPVNPIRV